MSPRMIVNYASPGFPPDFGLSDSSAGSPPTFNVNLSQFPYLSQQDNTFQDINHLQTDINTSTSTDRLTNLLLSVLDVIPANQLLNVFNQSLNQALHMRLGPTSIQKICNDNSQQEQNPSLLDNNQNSTQNSSPNSSPAQPPLHQNIVINSDVFLKKEEEEIFHKNLESNLESLFMQVYNNDSGSSLLNNSYPVINPVNNTNYISNNNASLNLAQNYFQNLPQTQAQLTTSITSFNSPNSTSFSPPNNQSLPGHMFPPPPPPSIQVHPVSSPNSTTSSYPHSSPAQLVTSVDSSLTKAPLSSAINLSQQPHFTLPQNDQISSPKSSFFPTPSYDSTEKLIAEFPGLISENVYDMASALRQMTEFKQLENVTQSYVDPAPLFFDQNQDQNQNQTQVQKHDYDYDHNHNQTQVKHLNQNHNPFEIFVINKSDSNDIQKQSNLLSVNEKWLSSNNLKKLRQIYGVTYLKGRFTANENKIINDIITKVCNEKGWSRETLEQFLFQKNPNDQEEYSGVWRQICKSIPNRPLQAMYHHIKRMFNPKNYQGNWTEEQDKKLAFWFERLGPRWEIIGRRIGRTGTNCRDRWRNIKQGNSRQTGRWTPEEKAKLKLSILQVREDAGFEPASINFGEDIGVSWELVSDLVKTRNASQCRGKWLSFASSSSSSLSSNMNSSTNGAATNSTEAATKENWTKSADLALLNSVKSIHSSNCIRISWKNVVSEMNKIGINCSNTQVKSRWNTLSTSIGNLKGLSVFQIADILAQNTE